MPSITISGKEFNIEPRFAVGHVLSENEAAALNQTFFENVRNNLASAVKKGELEDQAGVDAYAQAYVFGARRSGTARTPVDPVEAEALRIATEKVKEAIRAKGLTNVKATDIKAKAEEVLASEKYGESIRKLAKQRIAALQKVEAAEDDLLTGLESGPSRVKAKGEEAPAETPTADAVAA